MTEAIREDLSRRTALSKSLIRTFDLCNHKAWFGMHDPRPFIGNEKVTFGSAVDVGVEVLVKCASSDQPLDLDRAFAAAAAVVERDDIAVVFSQVEDAIEMFGHEVMPKFEWAQAVTQVSITATVEGLGICNGHPDIILGDGRIYDVKTSSRGNKAPSVELGFYAMLSESVGGLVPAVGYMTWIRARRPYWQVVEAPVTDELRRWTFERSSIVARAQETDRRMNDGEPEAVNYSFLGGPVFMGLCDGCPYNPDNDGPCSIAWRKGPPA